MRFDLFDAKHPGSKREVVYNGKRLVRRVVTDLRYFRQTFDGEMIAIGRCSMNGSTVNVDRSMSRHDRWSTVTDDVMEYYIRCGVEWIANSDGKLVEVTG